jgi:copper chaperone CopZ
MDALESVQGIGRVEVNVEQKTVEVSGNCDAGIIKKVLQDAGYPVQE